MRTDRKAHIAAAVVALLALTQAFACEDDEDDGTQLGRRDGAVADAATRISSEAEALGLMVELNQGEVSVSEVAAERAQRAPTLQFADRMVEEHGTLRQDLLSLSARTGIASGDSALRTMIADKARQTTEALRVQPTAGFDDAYLQGQVVMHMESLAILDGQVAPVVHTVELQSALTTMRGKIVGHLLVAQGLVRPATGDGGAANDGATGADAGLDAAPDAFVPPFVDALFPPPVDSPVESIFPLPADAGVVP
jgi:predicted outer membrane protein